MVTGQIIDRIFVKVEVQPVITCSKLIIETREQGVEYVQS